MDYSKLPFIELFAKTNFSFLEAASHPEEMVLQAHQLGYQGLGITDRTGLYGVVRAHVAAKKLGLPLVLGAQIYLDNKNPAFLIAKNREGYGNLCEILTQTLANPSDDIDLTCWKIIESKSSGLFFFLPTLTATEENILKAKAIFSKRLHLIVSQFLDGQDELWITRAQVLSRRFEVDCVASNQPLFHTSARKRLHDVLNCIRHRCSLNEAGFRLLPNHERHLKPLTEIEILFSQHPDWVLKSAEIAGECSFSLDDIRYQYPTEWLPAQETAETYLRKLTWQGAQKRYGLEIPQEVTEQIVHELALIGELKFCDYFLTIWDIVEFAKSKEILCQGRGSAANSIVCYLLGITAIDPVRMNLLFERFLSKERKEPPDIDIDFEHERREEVIQYIYERYGRDRAAITATVICFRRRSALREVRKVFNLNESDAPSESCNQLIDEIRGFPRHIGTHVGGFVLCQEALTRNMPVEPTSMPNRTIVQWDKNDLDALGFVRVDILGLGALSCLRKSFVMLKQLHHINLNLSTIPAEDPKVYDTLCLADTIGVFQIESRAQMNMLPRLRPRNFFDLVIEIALVRPGPIQGDMVHPYLRRRSGKEKIEYAHPKLEPILKKTCGVPLFQEQIMKMAMAVAGFSAGEADELRRAMGTWRAHGKNRIAPLGEKFRQGLIREGVSKDMAHRVFSQIEGFAEYGFPESHAASFAIITYATAWFKTYHPDIFITALLNSQPMGFYRTHTLLHDAHRHGVRWLKIDINQSLWDHQVIQPNLIQLGFREIRSLSQKAIGIILQARASGRFLNWQDFLQRTQKENSSDLTRRDLFALASANALDSLGWNRRQALWEIQSTHFSDSPWSQSEDLSHRTLPKEENWEGVALDFLGTGFSVSHPMQVLKEEFPIPKLMNSQELKKTRPRSKVRTAGMVICRQRPPTASGVLFITLEDEYGLTNLVIWNAIYEENKETLLNHSFLICEGRMEKAEDGNVRHLIVDTVESFFPTQALSVSSRDFR